MVFTTGICPLFTDLMIRYPHADVVGFRWQGILLAVAIGLFIGFCLPAGWPTRRRCTRAMTSIPPRCPSA